MTPPVSDVDDDALAERLIAFAEAPTQDRFSGESIPPELRGALDCVEQLEQLWPGTPAPEAPEAPTTLGRFRIERKLGQGGCGIVFLAHDPVLNRQVALKVPRPEAILSTTLRQRFLREAQAAAGLDHPNVVPIYEAAESGVFCYIASADCAGITLRAWLKKHGKRVGGRAAAELLAVLAEAVDYTHRQGVVHRDLKPGNVILVPGTDVPAGVDLAALPLDKLVPRITDFGLAKMLEEPPGQALTRTGAIFGTPHYMAPEQALGRTGATGPATDVYALGVMLYELLTGQVPFQATSDLDLLNHVATSDANFPAARRGDIHRDLETICLRCLQKDPARRYATALELAQELRRFLNGEPINTRPITRAERLWRWCRRKPALAALVVVSGFVLCVLLPGLLWYQARLDRASERQRLAEELAQAAQKAQKEADRAAIMALQAQKEADRAARTQQYYALVHGARDRISQQRLGWTWDALADLGKAAAIATESRDLIALRRDATACLAGIDLREIKRLPLLHKVYNLAVSPDGKTVAAAQARTWFVSCGVALIDADTAELKRTLTFSPSNIVERGRLVPDGVRSLAFHHGGQLVAAGTRGGWVHVWDLSGADAPRHSWKAAESMAIADLTFARDGQSLIVACSENRSLKRWDFAGKKLAQRATNCWPLSLALDPTGRVLASHGDGRLLFLDAETLQPLKEPLDYEPSLVRFDGTGRFLAAVHDRAIALVDASTGAKVEQFPDDMRALAHSGSVDDLVFARGGSVLVSSGSSEADRKVKLWEVASGRLAATLVAGTSGALPVAADPHGRWLVTMVGQDLVFYELGGGEVQSFVGFVPAPVQTIRFAPDGDTLFAAGAWQASGQPQGSFLASWRLKTGERKAFDIFAGATRSPALAVSPDGRFSALGNTAHLHFNPTAEAAAARSSPAHEIRKLVYIPGGANAAGKAAGEVKLASIVDEDYVDAWDPKDNKKLWRWSNATSVVITGKSGIYALAAGRSWVLAGGRDGITRLLQADTGQFVKTLPGFNSPVRSLALSPDETIAVIGTQKGDVHFVRVPDGDVIGAGLDHADSAQASALTADGKLLATGGRDGRVYLYRGTSKGYRHVLTLTMPAAVEDLAFAPDGSKLAVQVERETATRIWRLDRLFDKLKDKGLAGSDLAECLGK